MISQDLIQRAKNIAQQDAKWHALTLDMCKKELKPQYRVVKEFLGGYRG